MISIIVAISEDWGIGKDNELLWRIPEDLKRFKRLTTGNVIIMGKKTWESLPVKPLPDRTNIVLTDLPEEVIKGPVTAYSVEDALDKCDRGKEIFIIGGGSIYRQFMNLADRLYITHVHKSTVADVYFPAFDLKYWKVTGKEEFPENGGDIPPYTFTIYERKGCQELSGQKS